MRLIAFTASNEYPTDFKLIASWSYSVVRQNKIDYGLIIIHFTKKTILLVHNVI